MRIYRYLMRINSGGLRAAALWALRSGHDRDGHKNCGRGHKPPEEKILEPVQILTSQLVGIARDAIAITPQLVVALIVLGLTFVAARIARTILQRAMSGLKLRSSLKELFYNLTAIVVWVIGLMIAAIIVFPNLTPTNALAGLGLGSVAIGFAFKDVFENFLAGIIILFRREMRIGDHIECEDLEGKVEKITVRETHIRQTDGQLVIAPNAMLFTNPLTIRTDLDKRRVTVMCGIAYGENINEGRDIITGAVKSCESVDAAGHPIQVFASAFGASSIDFEVTWWTESTPLAVRSSRDEVITAIKSALDAAGIEIPFPYRTMTFSEPLHLKLDRSDSCNGAPGDATGA